MKKFVIILICVLISLLILISSFTMKNYVGVSKSTVKNYVYPVIIIDAGHGGFDGGAIATDGTVEKDINLKISKYLEEYLTLFGFKTIMVRETDCSVNDENLTTIRSKKTSDLHNRMKLMEETENSLFISIHQNKYHVEKYKGTQVFYSPNTKEESSVLAQCIQDVVVNKLQSDNTRQIKECGTSVFLMYKAIKPAVLVECGFLSNIEETKKLNNKEYQKKIALCIAFGIQNYISMRNE